MELWTRFHERTLAHEEWTHRAHVRIAYLHLKQYPFEEALTRLRTSILALNASHGVVETNVRGYSETITVAFLKILAELLEAYPHEGSSEDFCDQNPQIMTPKVLRLYYSRERLWQDGAKEAFVEPDLSRWL